MKIKIIIAISLVAIGFILSILSWYGLLGEGNNYFVIQVVCPLLFIVGVLFLFSLIGAGLFLLGIFIGFLAFVTQSVYYYNLVLIGCGFLVIGIIYGIVEGIIKLVKIFTKLCKIEKSAKIIIILIIGPILAYIVVTLINLGFIPLNFVKNDEVTIRRICSTGEFGVEAVYRCGDYYEQMPSHNWADVPYKIFNLNGKFVTSCGGMPGPSFEFSPMECSAKCGYTNLCSLGTE